MKRRLICVVTLVIFVTIGLMNILISQGDRQVYAATANFTASENVSLDLWAPEDIENAFKNALSDFSVKLETTLTNTMNTTINDLLPATINDTIETFFATMKEDQDELLNTILIYFFCVLITGAAFWRKEAFLDIVAAGVDIFLGEIFASQQDVASLGWAVGVVIMAIGSWMILYRIRIEIVRKRKRENE